MKYKLKKFNNKYKYIGGSKKVIDLICDIINPRLRRLNIRFDRSLENNIIFNNLIAEIEKISTIDEIDFLEEDIGLVDLHNNYIIITPINITYDIDIKANKILHLL